MQHGSTDGPQEGSSTPDGASAAGGGSSGGGSRGGGSKGGGNGRSDGNGGSGGGSHDSQAFGQRLDAAATTGDYSRVLDDCWIATGAGVNAVTDGVSDGVTNAASAPSAVTGEDTRRSAPRSPPAVQAQAAAAAMERHFEQHAQYERERLGDEERQQQQQVVLGGSQCEDVLSSEQRASMALNASIIEDQQKALRKVAEEVTGLNELFVELGHIVASQGEEVENVASLAHRMADDVQAARQELERAELDQQKGGCVLS